MPSTSPRAREAFEASTDFTVGLEEEFAILDPPRWSWPAASRTSRGGGERPGSAESISPDLIAAEIEIRSGRGEDFADARRAASAAGASAALRVADSQDAALGATGTHPWPTTAEQDFIDTDHYRRVARRPAVRGQAQQHASRCTSTSACGAPTAPSASATGCGPCCRSCSRSAPTRPSSTRATRGCTPARTQAFTKTFPRCGIPDAFGDWARYADYIDFLDRTGSIVEYTQVWWSVRPHFSFGTVEVRICDAQATAAESDGAVRR